MSLDWKTLKSEKVYDAKIFSVILAERECHDGRIAEFVRLDSPDWVVVIPWFKSDGIPTFVMEDQWRHGTNSAVREFPAGTVEKGEAAIDAASRELLEETGMTGKLIELGNVCPNNAFMNNRQTFFLATDLRKVASQNLDPNEEIEIVNIPVEEVVKDMGKGIYDNGIMMAALGFFLRYSESNPELRSCNR